MSTCQTHETSPAGANQLSPGRKSWGEGSIDVSPGGTTEFSPVPLEWWQRLTRTRARVVPYGLSGKHRKSLLSQMRDGSLRPSHLRRLRRRYLPPLRHAARSGRRIGNGIALVSRLLCSTLALLEGWSSFRWVTVGSPISAMASLPTTRPPELCNHRQPSSTHAVEHRRPTETAARSGR